MMASVHSKESLIGLRIISILKTILHKLGDHSPYAAKGNYTTTHEPCTFLTMAVVGLKINVNEQEPSCTNREDHPP